MNRRSFIKSSLALLAVARMGRSTEPVIDTHSLVEGNSRFALELYAKLREAKGNIFCSPFSISSALAMTSLGARGKTAAQMSDVLHLPAAAPAEFSAILGQLNGGTDKRGYQLNVANALWGQKGYGFRDEFLRTAKAHYGAGLNEMDFAADAEAARKTINGWVEKETRDKIKDLLAPGTIMADTRLVLTNAIYFKGDWADQFNKKATFDEPFFAGGDKSAKVPMMHRTGHYTFFQNDDLQMLSAPYKGKELSMLFLLPRKKDGLADLESAATPDNVPKWIAKLYGTDVIVTLPKFKMTAEFKLVPTLRSMGMTEPFGPTADFSGMSEKEGLLISDVIHKAFVEVNEEGAEAAAATGVVMRPTAMPQGGPKPIPVFRADPPFLFLSRDNRNGSILFVGRVANPA
jgi:serpin B